MEKEEPVPSIFQKKYDEFVEDLMGAVPEYAAEIQSAKALDTATRLAKFHEEVSHDVREESDIDQNPGTILPGVTLSDSVWSTLSEQSRSAIYEHLRILSICAQFEHGFGSSDSPSWIQEAMEEMKKKLDSVEFKSMPDQFGAFFKTMGPDDGPDDGPEEEKGKKEPKLEDFFQNGIPKLPERFLKGQLAKLAKELIKEITPEDLGLDADVVSQCEKDPSRSFQLLFSTFSKNPEILQRMIGNIGKKLQAKVQSGAIRPQEIAAEAEDLMKEFSNNSAFVEMMEGIKNAFGMGDLGMARKAGKEGSARLSMARDRLRKKLEKKKEQAKSNMANKK
jgi:hypothetical protein